MTADVKTPAVTQADLAYGRRLKAILLALSAAGVVIVLIAGNYWNYLGRITVLPNRAGDRVSVSVSSPSHRAGFADLTAVVHTTAGRVLRIQSDVKVPARGQARHVFDFGPQLSEGEHVTTYKVKK